MGTSRELDKTKHPHHEQNGYHSTNEEGLMNVLALYGFFVADSDLDFDLFVAHFVTKNLRHSSSS